MYQSLSFAHDRHSPHLRFLLTEWLTTDYCTKNRLWALGLSRGVNEHNGFRGSPKCSLSLSISLSLWRGLSSSTVTVVHPNLLSFCYANKGKDYASLVFTNASHHFSEWRKQSSANVRQNWIGTKLKHLGYFPGHFPEDWESLETAFISDYSGQEGRGNKTLTSFTVDQSWHRYGNQ